MEIGCEECFILTLSVNLKLKINLKLYLRDCIAQIIEWTNDIAALYPEILKREVLITSEEGREIPKLTLGSSSSNPIILIDCGIHAREWISPAFCQCWLNRVCFKISFLVSKTRLQSLQNFYVKYFFEFLLALSSDRCRFVTDMLQ